MQSDRENMKAIELTKRTTAELVGRMIIEENIIESTQLNIIRGQIENPSFNYGAPNSLWELYQHTTYAMKEVHPSLWMRNHINAHTFFVNAAGIMVAPTEIDAVPTIMQLEQLELF